jgi:hypothetical protein
MAHKLYEYELEELLDEWKLSMVKDGCRSICEI